MTVKRSDGEGGRVQGTVETLSPNPDDDAGGQWRHSPNPDHDGADVCTAGFPESAPLEE